MNSEVSRALELAKQKYGPKLERSPLAMTQDAPALITSQSLPMARIHAVHPSEAFDAGQRAQYLGRMRVTPYYERPGSDHFWFAGYDGKTMEEAIGSQ